MSGSRCVLAAACASVLLLLAVGVDPPVAVAEDEEVTEKELKRRKSRLRTRALAWMRERKRLTGKCRRCRGRGYVVEVVAGVGGGRRPIQCPMCEARKRVVYSSVYRKLFYEMMSPAFRMQDGITDRLNAEYKRANDPDKSRGERFPDALTTYRLRDYELVYPAYGVAWFEWNKDKTAKPFRWIWAQERGKKSGDWFVYDEEADGPWPARPTGTEEAGEDGPADPGSPFELSSDQQEALEAALAPLGELPFALTKSAHEGDTLVLHMGAKPVVPGQRTPEENVGAAAVKVKRTLFPALDGWKAIRCVWYRPWKDKFGKVASLPFYTSSFSRANFRKVQWENLTAQERVEVLEWTQHDQPGWKCWDG